MCGGGGGGRDTKGKKGDSINISPLNSVITESGTPRERCVRKFIEK